MAVISLDLVSVLICPTTSPPLSEHQAERTQGTAPFRLWAGVAAGNIASTGQPGGVIVWYNKDCALGLTVQVAWVPNLPPFQPNNAAVDCPTDLNQDGPNRGKCNAPRLLMTAAYVVYADQGAWSVPFPPEKTAPDPAKTQAAVFALRLFSAGRGGHRAL